jgi:glutaredoxin-related protein
MGKGQANTFSLVCSGNQISAYINNRLVRTVSDNSYADGQVGISASSFDSGDALVGFDWVSISEP